MHLLYLLILFVLVWFLIWTCYSFYHFACHFVMYGNCKKINAKTKNVKIKINGQKRESFFFFPLALWFTFHVQSRLHSALDLLPILLECDFQRFPLAGSIVFNLIQYKKIRYTFIKKFTTEKVNGNHRPPQSSQTPQKKTRTKVSWYTVGEDKLDFDTKIVFSVTSKRTLAIKLFKVSE